MNANKARFTFIYLFADGHYKIPCTVKARDHHNSTSNDMDAGVKHLSQLSASISP